MKLLKKLIPLTVGATMIFTLTGCGSDKNSEEAAKHEKNPIATMQVEYETAEGETKQGEIKIELFANDAPDTVANFVNLANNGFYDGLTFHRIVENFMIQGGDPEGNGSGSAKVSDIDKSVEKDSDEDYEYSIKGEFTNNNFKNKKKFKEGTVAMARSDYSSWGLTEEGYNSACSQFFIVNTDSSINYEHLQGDYAVFGEVIDGYDIVQELSKVQVKENEQSGEMSQPVKAPIIKSITVETFGEKYDIPDLINAEEVTEKINQLYTEFMELYYNNDSSDE